MIETRYAILAMGLLSLLAVQYQRDLATTGMQMILSEVHLVASGVGTEHLDWVGTRSFEEITHLHDDQRTTLVILDSDTLSFDLTSSVRFVEIQETGKKKKGKKGGKGEGNVFVEAQGPTDYQEVIVTIQGLLNSTVTMTRIYSRVST